jgi:protein-S-isoprenylcysteine O-methyltransferase Ste14
MTMQDMTAAPGQSERRAAYLQIEDKLGKLVLLLLFLWHFSQVWGSLLRMLANPQLGVMWVLSFVSTICSVGFVGLIVFLTVARTKPVDVQPGFEARFSAFMGTFVLLALIAIPPAGVPMGQAIVAMVLIIVGTVSSTWCLWWLGRSFAVMAAARRIVVAGPYAIVRHPLYATESLIVIGCVLMNGTPLAFLVGALQFFFQYRRMVNEEKVLARALEGYTEYMSRTPMVIPRLFVRG